MNSPEPVPAKRRWSVGRWILLGAALMLLPVFVVGVAALSFVTLDRDAAVLRREVVTATHSQWKTKVQVSAGWFTLSAARAILHFVAHEHRQEAQLALASVSRASVGVYERQGSSAVTASLADVFVRTDRSMQKRNLHRLVSVQDDGKTVLVYASDTRNEDDPIDLCVAVVDRDQLVVVSSTMKPAALQKLIETHLPKGGLGAKLAAL